MPKLIKELDSLTKYKNKVNNFIWRLLVVPYCNIIESAIYNVLPSRMKFDSEYHAYYQVKIMFKTIRERN